MGAVHGDAVPKVDINTYAVRVAEGEAANVAGMSVVVLVVRAVLLTRPALDILEYTAEQRRFSSIRSLTGRVQRREIAVIGADASVSPS